MKFNHEERDVSDDSISNRLVALGYRNMTWCFKQSK